MMEIKIILIITTFFLKIRLHNDQRILCIVLIKITVPYFNNLAYSYLIINKL